MEDRLPDRARDFDDPGIRKEFGELPAHGSCVRRVGGAEVDQQDADFARRNERVVGRREHVRFRTSG